MPKIHTRLLERLETYFNTVPAARAERFGPLTLHVQTEGGWPYCARPAGTGGTPTVDDIQAVRARQRELGVPEVFEWVHENVPGLRDTARAAGLHVHSHPLMVLDAAARPPRRPPLPNGVVLRRIPADATDLAIVHSVPTIAFSFPGTGTGDAGPRERDAIAPGQDPALLGFLNERLRRGTTVTIAACGLDGPLSVGSYQSAGDVTEIVGVGTLPAARRHGLAAALTWALVDHRLEAGNGLVFLSAGDDDVARMYAGLGFRRVATAVIAEA